MSILVVIPVYNRHRLILDCLASVEAQTRRPDDVVVSDDGSTDDTVAAVRGRARLIESSARTGAAGARNRGFAGSGADYVAFLDSDDLWPADFLERTCALLDATPAAVGATTDIRTVRNGRSEKFRPMRGIERDAAGELFRSAGIGSATLLRAAAVRQLGGYDESLLTGHDAALFLRLSLLGPWLHAPGAPTVKRQGFARPGEDAHVYQRHPDHKRRWAEVYDAFAREHPRFGPSVAKRWRRAGMDLRRQGRVEDARTCFRRGLAWRPRSLRLWWSMLTT